MDNIEVSLKEIINYTNEDTFKYWILISYRASIWRGETFKEAVLINIKKHTYWRDNILDENNLTVIVEIEEKRTINFPLGSIFDSLGNLINNASQSLNKDGIYAYNVWIDPYEDFINPFVNNENFNTDFINDVPCYYKRVEQSSKLKDTNIEIPPTTFIIPVHSILDFFFYENTNVTNILANNFESIRSLKCFEPNILSYPSTIINRDAAESIGKYLFTKYNSGYKALNKINDHQSEWLNQAKRNELCRAYVKTNLPFSIKTKLSIKGIFLTERDSKDKKFLVFSIEEATPVQSDKSFFEISKLILIDLTDKRSSDSSDSKPVKEYNGVINQNGQYDHLENQELSNDPVNNSLPEVENDTIKNKKFRSDLDFDKLPRLDQLNKYVKNKNILLDIKQLSTNYNEQSGNSETAKYQAIEEKSFSFFKVFFQAMELLRKEGNSVGYLSLNEMHLYSRLTIASSETKIKSGRRSLVVCICQVKIESSNYVIIESGENKYIGMFSCTNNYSFEIKGDIRIKTFLEEVLNIHNYNWSKINVEMNSDFQKKHNIKIFRPIEHEMKKYQLLSRGHGIEKKEYHEIINILAANLAKKIKIRALKDIKENY